MNAKTFIEENRKWGKGEKGTFDYNGIIGLLEDYHSEIEKQQLDKVKIRVHGHKLNEGKFEELSKPMIKYLCENFHPHVTVVITPTSAELLEGLKGIKCDEFIVD